MSALLAFTVPGQPEPLRRHRAAVHGGRVRTFDDPRNGNYADWVRWAWQSGGGHTMGQKPFILDVEAFFARPKSHQTSRGELSAAGRRARPPRPDVDNIAKAILDALNGLAWDDDTQCVWLAVMKRWAQIGESGCTIVRAGLARA